MTSVMPKFDDGTIIQDGTATLGPAATRLLNLTDSVFAGWADSAGALPMTMPPLLTVAELASLDVYRNFPHLSMVATTLETGGLPDASPAEIAPGSLQHARMAMPSAVCYGFYLRLRDRTLTGKTALTAVGTCYRNEDHFDGLRRLRAFRMREVAMLGQPEQVRQHLERFTNLIVRFTEAAGLEIERQAANDPFFDPDGAQARWQQLDAVKHEFCFGDLAIASANEHRKFFGQRCRISLDDGTPASTGCAAFGLERWVHALAVRYRGNWEAAYAAVEAGRAATAAPHLVGPSAHPASHRSRLSGGFHG